EAEGWEARRTVASAHMSRAMSLGEVQRHGEAIADVDLSIAIRRRALANEGRLDAADGLARAYETKAQLLAATGQVQQSIEVRAEAFGLFVHLVQKLGRSECRPDLA